MTQEKPFDSDGWDECEPGTLGQLHRRLRASRRMEAVRRMVLPTSLVAVLLVGAWFAFGLASRTGYDYGGVTCQDVSANMHRFQTGQLLPDERQAFEVHVANCPDCRERMRRMESDTIVSERHVHRTVKSS